MLSCAVRQIDGKGRIVFKGYTTEVLVKTKVGWMLDYAKRNSTVT